MYTAALTLNHASLLVCIVRTFLIYHQHGPHVTVFDSDLMLLVCLHILRSY